MWKVIECEPFEMRDGTLDKRTDNIHVTHIRIIGNHFQV